MQLKDNLRWFELSLMLFIFMFCFAPKLSIIAILFIVITVIVAYIKKEVYFNINLVSLCFIGLYMSYLFGVLWTNNSELAGKYLENKLSFLIIPILLSFKFKNEQFSLRLPIIGFTLGMIISSLYGIWNAYFNCYKTMDTILCFSASHLSPIHHPTYFAAFHFASILLIWYGYKKNFPWFNRTFVYCYIAFSILYQGFLMSLAGILFLVIIIFLLLVRFVYLRTNRFKFYAFVLFFLIVMLLGFRYVPYLNEEIQQSYSELSTFIDSPSNYVESQKFPFSGNATRLSMWIVSMDVFIEHPFGVGTGNVDYFLGEKLRSLNQPEFAALEYNPHNQYLQTGIEVGIIGLIFLVGIIYFGIKKAIEFKNWMAILLIVNFAFNMFFESMLQRQSGIIFYTFLICLLVIYSQQLSTKREV